MTEEAALRPEEQLQRKLSRGLRWSVVNTLVLRFGSLATGAVLLRIIAPAEYGVYGSALIVVTALLSMNELGVSLAIVRRGGDVRSIAPTVATLALATSVALYMLTWAVAPAVAAVLNAPGATPMIRVLATCVLVDAVSAVPAQVLAREFAQGRRFAIDIVGFVAGTGLSIVLALTGHGAWSLVWGFLLTNVVAGGLAIMLSPWRTGYGFDRSAARELLAFGLPLAGSSMLLFVMLNVDYLVVGNVLGATALGLYLNAFTLASWPVNLVSATVRRVTLATFSRAADGDEEGRRRAYLSALRGVLVLTIPMCTGLAVFAEQVIGTLYGAEWVPAAQALAPLAVLALARVVVELTYDYLVSADRNSSNLVLQAVWLAVLVPALVIGAHLDGIRGVGRAHALVALTVVAGSVYIALRRTGIHASELAHAAARPLLAAVPMAFAGWGSTRFVDGWLPALLVGGTLATGVYAALTLPMLLDLRRRLASPAPV